MVPGVVPVDLLVARTDTHAVLVDGLLLYPTGFDFDLVVRRRPGHPRPPGHRWGHDLRLEVRFADGRAADSRQAKKPRLRCAWPLKVSPNQATGWLRQRSWETPEGDKRSVTEIEADEVGASLKWATAKVERTHDRGVTDSAQGRERTAERGGDFNDPAPF